ncbi:MAG: hypothetical protein ABS76_25870 [Pelagibacterium sp. SCN 64-44]|nr:MAG: hypothetical protein ABS76_25870 [Pelagibacterium sp. SCN 64-44]
MLRDAVAEASDCIWGKGAGNGRTLPHAARHLARARIGKFGKANKLDQRLYPCMVDCLAGNAKWKCNIFSDRQPGKQRMVLECNTQLVAPGKVGRVCAHH